MKITISVIIRIGIANTGKPKTRARIPATLKELLDAGSVDTLSSK